MSRQLPARPNLEHLKNLAKERLVDLRQQDPEAKLADALHLVAREYGFASWPKLKAEVEQLLVAPASTEAAESPFIGVWRADVARSTRHPANQFQQATLQFVVSGDTITVTDVVISASGEEQRGVNSIQADGVEREFAGGYAVMVRRIGSHAIEMIAKKDGAIVGQGLYEVSPDRLTLTVSSRNARANKDGWQSDVDQVIVFDRIQPS